MSHDTRKIVDVVMLTNSADRMIVDMTQEAIRTLHTSEPDVQFKVWLVESNLDFRGTYADIASLIRPRGPFNYNRFLNAGLQYCLADHVLITNNDVVFTPGWLTECLRVMEEQNLDSCSTRSPLWGPHIATEPAIDVGLEVSHQFCGWNLLFKKESLQKLLPLDERFAFWYQDNDMAKNMGRLGLKHALVRTAVVVHLESASHRLLTGAEVANLTSGQRPVFLGKWPEDNFRRPSQR